MNNQLSKNDAKRQHGPAHAGPTPVGIRELKARASAIVREVADCDTTYAVTRRGKVEALIVPVHFQEGGQNSPEAQRAWTDLESLASDLAREKRRPRKSAMTELRRMRR